MEEIMFSCDFCLQDIYPSQDFYFLMSTTGEPAGHFCSLECVKKWIERELSKGEARSDTNP